ncbi:Universal stress protein family protein [Roseovarius albus]|uniref:Universal stress protein family protein n=1 Tax=Roseovarius albus TaxID=1247867 RepID=A0A1X6Y4Q3_9RHOB|nr:universal stress protein [Roseovarius albus]SLN10562.1 Universal stress protein family protein [Roseovarius albus]
MAIKTLFTAVTDDTLVDPVLDHAIAMASTHDAHLDVLCLGVDRTHTGYYYAGASAMVFQEAIGQSQAQADQLEQMVQEKLQGQSIRWSTDKGVSQLPDLTRPVSARARFSDLTILPMPYADGRGAELEPTTEAVLFEGQCPALLVPDDHALNTRPEQIMIAWNESAEAINAIRASLPLLCAARSVRVVVVDPPQHGPSRSDPGGPLSQYLARHGVSVEIDVLSRTLPRIADVLNRHAIDTGADLLVMGAYGHSRFREAVFGGATRNMLEHAKVPVLLAH